MKGKILLFLLLLCTNANAEYWVCFDDVTKYPNRVVIGDGKLLGISQANNQNIVPNCILAKEWEFNEAREANVKVDINQIEGARIVKLSQAEIDANTAAKAQDAETAKAASVAEFDTKIDGVKLNDLTLTKVDAKIDAISNLTEAKAFLKLLVRAIVKLEAGQ